MNSCFNFRCRIRNWLLPVTSGVMMMLAFPPWNSMQWAWVSFLPLLFALQDCTVGQAFRRGYIAGLVFFGGTIWWVGHVTVAGTVLLIAFLALYFATGASWLAWLFARARATDGNPSSDSVVRNLLVAAAGAAGWVALEWVRGWLLMGGFPWNFIGVSQWRAVVLIQIASVTGVYGVSAVVVFANIGFFFTVNRFARYILQRGRIGRLSWEFYAAMVALCGVVVYGARVLRDSGASAGESRTLSLALIQANIPQSLKFDPGQEELIVDRHRSLTETAMTAHPDLMIWPETSTVGPLRYSPSSYGLLTNLAARANAPILVGTFDVDFFDGATNWYNAAALVRPDGRVDGVYRKIHLVPFGEYVPWRKVFPFLKWFTPVKDSLERGTQQTVFTVGGNNPVTFSVVICFEDTIAPLYRQFARADVDFMVNVTNDAWFRESPAAEMHLANAVFRAVETGRPLIRATNNGITCVVNERGAVVKRLEPFAVGFMQYQLQVPMRPSPTLYVQYGDVFVLACLIACAGAALWLQSRRRTQPKRGDGVSIPEH